MDKTDNYELWAVDRTEGDLAVLCRLGGEEHRRVNVPLSELGQGTRGGDVFLRSPVGWQYSAEETCRRKDEDRERTRALFGASEKSKGSE